MAGNFRKLIIWQEAVRLALKVYKLTNKYPKEEMYGLTSQSRRSAVSVAGNIAESAGRFGYRDKIHLIIIARGSIEETRSHLSISYALGYIGSKEFGEIDQEYELLAKQVNVFIKTIGKPHQQPIN